MGINPVEAVTLYAARQLNPWTSFFAKLSKNNDLPGPLGFGDKDTDRSAFRDVISQLTGVGFYQGWPQDNTDDKDGAGQFPFVEEVMDAFKNAAVGPGSINDIEAVRGVAAALKPFFETLKNNNKYRTSDSGVNSGDGSYSSEGSGWINYPDFQWKDFGNWWKNYGNGGYGGYNSSGSYGSSSSSGVSMEFWELIQALKKLVDQGDVTDA
jgi:hypothetical protein